MACARNKALHTTPSGVLERLHGEVGAHRVGEHEGMLGLICADGTLFSRKQRKPIEKESDLSLTGSWTILF